MLWRLSTAGEGLPPSELTAQLVGQMMVYSQLCGNPNESLPKREIGDSADRVIRAGFLDSESRQDLIELTRDGSAAHRLARRANALLLLDDGMSCEAVAKVVSWTTTRSDWHHLDDDTIRTWHRLYQEDGIEGLASFGYEGCACRLTAEQREADGVDHRGAAPDEP